MLRKSRPISRYTSCPACQARVRVVDTMATDAGEVRRRRQCDGKLRHRWWTVEHVVGEVRATRQAQRQRTIEEYV